MKFVDSLRDMIGKGEGWAMKNAPQLLVGAGLVGMGITVVLACKETLQAKKIVEEHKEHMDLIDEAEHVLEIDPVTKKAHCGYEPNKERVMTICETTVSLTKNYMPAILTGSLSVVSILCGFDILNTRYLGTVAAFNAVSETFSLYRGRVRNEYGEDVDRHLMYGTEIEEREVQELDDNGDPVTVKEVNETIEVTPSQYARVFDETNKNWDPSPTFNLMWLRAQQQIANDILHSRSNPHLFLNEVYEMLGFEHTPTGAVVGWFGKDTNVDFGLYDIENGDVRRFINGNHNCILLDFNVDDEVIWDKV